MPNRTQKQKEYFAKQQNALDKLNQIILDDIYDPTFQAASNRIGLHDLVLDYEPREEDVYDYMPTEETIKEFFRRF